MDFAAVAGVLRSAGTSGAAPAGWPECVARLASRVDAPVRQSGGASRLVAYRGREGGYHAGESSTVLLDGTVDNLRELARAAALPWLAEGGSDAATLAMLHEHLSDALWPRLTGSFALAIVRHATGEATLVRDRFGTRPMHYAATPDGWAWASEIKCLCPLLGSARLDAEGLRQAIQYRYTVAETLLEGVTQVLPAGFVRLAPGKPAVETPYWRLAFRPADPGDGLDAWADRVDAALDGVMTRLSTTHPRVGVLLSGGVDSSLLAVKALKGGFRDCVALTACWRGENPELEHARAIARHIGIEHQVVDIDDARLEGLLPWIVWRQEELPRHFNSLILAGLMEHARGRCDVLLHGHSADTLFGLHEIFALENFNRRRRTARLLPRPLRAALSACLPLDGRERVSRVRSYLDLDEHGFIRSWYAIKYGRAGAPAGERYYLARGPSPRGMARFYEPDDTPVERFQRYGTYSFNHSHLCVLDRIGAPFGMPVAKPFIAPEMVDIATELPRAMKSVGRTAKPVLKRLMGRSFPAEWVYREKQGFPTHTTRWLRGPLRRWHDMLREERTAARGVISPAALLETDVEHSHESIWSSVCLELFCRQFVDGEGGPS